MMFLEMLKEDVNVDLVQADRRDGPLDLGDRSRAGPCGKAREPHFDGGNPKTGERYSPRSLMRRPCAFASVSTACSMK